MKKVFFFICLFAFSINSQGRIISSDLFATSLIQQSNSIQQGDDWERLGSISAISEYGKKESFGLYVKVIAGEKYYQVRKYYSNNGFSSYSVARGRFTFKGKEYNAKFSYFDITYYFNI